ncbi:MAG: hypothetical protein FJ104_09640, partial [Deltaproteobacteria bacterium]|nr:hypothetical protein [Deltaproteobacteria bacterium]
MTFPPFRPTPLVPALLAAAAAACGDAGAGGDPGGSRSSLGTLRLADGVPGVVVA